MSNSNASNSSNTPNDSNAPNIRNAYNHWAQQYDTNKNRTRDLEAIALRETLGAASSAAPVPASPEGPTTSEGPAPDQPLYAHCLEAGCGTGKNSVWLAGHCQQLTAMDFSESMLLQAKEKLAGRENVRFFQADITQPWPFADAAFDLVTFSLVLEHIEQLGPVFHEAARCLRPGGRLYLGELHPFKQYTGTKARFETEAGTQVVDCYNHHISDFLHAARAAGLQLKDLNEYFDPEEGEAEPSSTSTKSSTTSSGLPRILTLLFEKEG